MGDFRSKNEFSTISFVKPFDIASALIRSGSKCTTFSGKVQLAALTWGLEATFCDSCTSVCNCAHFWPSGPSCTGNFRHKMMTLVRNGGQLRTSTLSPYLLSHFPDSRQERTPQLPSMKAPQIFLKTIAEVAITSKISITDGSEFRNASALQVSWVVDLKHGMQSQIARNGGPNVILSLAIDNLQCSSSGNEVWSL